MRQIQLLATVHEACTTMNTEDVHADGAFCAYWTDGVGDKFTGSKYTIRVAIAVFQGSHYGYTY